MFSSIEKNKLSLGIITVLVIGLVVAVVLSRQPTQTQQKASENINLNSSSQISNTNNTNGTMGPQTWQGNFSNGLSNSRLGSLTVMVSDPSEGKSGLTPTKVQGKQATAGPQTVKSLILKVSKVEVHLAYLVSPSANPTQQPVDHWETLNMPQPVSMDLVQLAQGGVAPLGLTNLAAGKYTEVRLYIQNATATLTDGTNVNLNILGKDNIVRIVEPFSIDVGKNTTLVVDFDAQHSVTATGNGQYQLKPVVSKFLENK